VNHPFEIRSGLSVAPHLGALKLRDGAPIRIAMRSPDAPATSACSAGHQDSGAHRSEIVNKHRPVYLLCHYRSGQVDESWVSRVGLTVIAGSSVEIGRLARTAWVGADSTGVGHGS
jgi:hypothetical protein